MYKLPNKTEKQIAPTSKRFSISSTAIVVVLCCAAIVVLDALKIKLFEFAEISTVSRTAFR